MYPIYKKIRSFNNALLLVTVGAAVLLIIVALPWISGFGFLKDYMPLGLPFAYFASLFVVPVIAVFLLLAHKNISEDIDRHTLEFENE